MAQTRLRTRRRTPEVLTLEDRTLLSSAPSMEGAQQVAAGGPAYVNQLYYDLLGRAPTAEESQRGSADFDNGRSQQLVSDVVNGQAYREDVVGRIYREYLNRAPDQGGLDSWVDFLDRGATVQDVRVGVLSSPEYFSTQAGNDNARFVRALYTDVLLRGADPSSDGWVTRLNQGGSRTEVAQGVVFSPESSGVYTNYLYARFLARTPDQGGFQNYVNLLNARADETAMVAGFVNSQEYTSTARNVTNNAVEALLANPNYSTLAQAVQAAGLVETLSGPGPFTIFAPTNAAFAALPAGTLDTLLQPANQQQLRALLTYHVTPGIQTGPLLAGEGIVTSVQGSRIGISPTAAGGLNVNTADVVAPNIRVQNGIVHGIDEVLTIPTNNIVQTAQANPDLSTLVTAVTAAGLVDTLSGPGPFTVFAPTNAAFAALPAGTLDSLLEPANQQQLRNLLLYHVTPGQFGTPELNARGLLPSAFGPNLRFSRSGNAFLVNTATIQVSNVVTTNGIVQVINQVLQPPPTA